MRLALKKLHERSVLRGEIVVLIEHRTIAPEECHTVRTVGSNEPSVRSGEELVDLNTFGEGIGCLQHIDIVGRAV